jgi:sugar phosphate permease
MTGSPGSVSPTTSSRRWVVLAIGTLTQAATASFVYGMALLVPVLRHDEHLSLVAASVVVSAPAVGLLLTLIAFGAAADRYGERMVIAIGVGFSALFLVIASAVHGPVLLCLLLGLAGAGAGSVNAASGRMVMGWFSVRERGLAMGTRQTAQPIGVGVAALTLPPLGAHFGAHDALLFPALLCAVCAVAVVLFVRDPPRPPAVVTDAGGSTEIVRATSPYRGNSTLARIHLASALLVVPQFAVATYTLVFLVGERNWDAIAAGRLIFGFQLAGAVGRIGSGLWSDRVGSRLRPMRQLAVTAALLMAGLAIGAWTGGSWIVVVFGLAAVITVADNGLAYVSVAEMAGSSWAGRALGIQNTGQNIVAIVVVPLLATIIEGAGYGLAFAIVALAALGAIPVTPVRAERENRLVAGPNG